MICRHCKAEVNLELVDLKTSPPSNSYLKYENLFASEKYYPLRVMVCNNCWLAQTEDYAAASELFDKDYAYFSGFSDSWKKHCRDFSKNAVNQFSLDASSLVIEVASNDGTLLENFLDFGVPVLGIEPTSSTAKVSREKGILTVEKFFGNAIAGELIEEFGYADLIIANNVLAHVPDINDFILGFARILKNNGVAVFEFPHLVKLILNVEFDTIYHEHYSYLSLLSVKSVLEKNGLELFNVEELSTHGGSLRIYTQKIGGSRAVEQSVKKILNYELDLGVNSAKFYKNFQYKVNLIKNDFLEFLIKCKKSGKSVVGYGAAAKGNTLLNYSGVGDDLIEFIADKNPHKVGKFAPGSRIPIRPISDLLKAEPSYVVILPWNLKDEIIKELSEVFTQMPKIVTLIPHLKIYD